jgi:hypothetical protein
LRALRREMESGAIKPGELKRRVIAACQKMAMPDIHDELGDELGLINDRGLRDFMYSLLERLPRYYWHVPASIMGFHDHSTDNLLGGLVRHSKKVARVAERIGEPYGLQHHADDLVVAAILHDSFKYGENGSLPSGHDHSTFAAWWLESNGIFNDRPQIIAMVRSHCGKWGRVHPANNLEWAFHLADFVVSRGAAPEIKPSGRYQIVISGRRHHPARR